MATNDEQRTAAIVEAYRRAGAEVTAALTQAGCDSPQFFGDVMKRLQIRHVEDDAGGFSVVVMDEKGQPRIQENKMPVSVKQATHELIKGQKALRRAIFDKLPSTVRHGYIKSGGKLFD